MGKTENKLGLKSKKTIQATLSIALLIILTKYLMVVYLHPSFRECKEGVVAGMGWSVDRNLEKQHLSSPLTPRSR